MRLRVRRSKSLSAGQIFLWSTLGLGGGLLAGFALSEWVGGVNQTRMRRAAKSLGHSSHRFLDRGRNHWLGRRPEVEEQSHPREDYCHEEEPPDQLGSGN